MLIVSTLCGNTSTPRSSMYVVIPESNKLKSGQFFFRLASSMLLELLNLRTILHRVQGHMHLSMYVTDLQWIAQLTLKSVVELTTVKRDGACSIPSGDWSLLDIRPGKRSVHKGPSEMYEHFQTLWFSWLTIWALDYTYPIVADKIDVGQPITSDMREEYRTLLQNYYGLRQLYFLKFKDRGYSFPCRWLVYYCPSVCGISNDYRMVQKEKHCAYCDWCSGTRVCIQWSIFHSGFLQSTGQCECC